MTRRFSALVVDDSITCRMIETAIVYCSGFNVFAVEGAEQAIDLFRLGIHFDIVFMDMEMLIKDGSQVISFSYFNSF